MNTRILFAIGIALLLLGVAGAVVQQRAPETEPAATADGAPAASASDATFAVRLYRDPKPIPAFTVRTIDGRTLTASDLRGKVTIVNFWATWCPPCREEMPALVALQEKYRDHLVVLGVSEDEGPIDGVKEFIAAHKINFPIVMTTPELQKIFPGVNALPTTFVLDREMRVAQKHIGMLDPTRTEHETLALAGLARKAEIELVEPDKPIGLANAAQAKEIPGIDLTQLTAAQRVTTLTRLNSEACTCGCGLTVARCRIEDPSCGVSLPVAKQIVAEITGTQ